MEAVQNSVMDELAKLKKEIIELKHDNQTLRRELRRRDARISNFEDVYLTLEERQILLGRTYA